VRRLTSFLLRRLTGSGVDISGDAAAAGLRLVALMIADLQARKDSATRFARRKLEFGVRWLVLVRGHSARSQLGCKRGESRQSNPGATFIESIFSPARLVESPLHS
jgi:hypothetical protein